MNLIVFALRRPITIVVAMIAIVLGLACYPLVLLVAWLACGRPNGVERALITQLSRLLAQVRAR